MKGWVIAKRFITKFYHIMLNKYNVEFKESMADVRENFEISKEDPKYMICTICGSKLSNCFWLDFWSLWIDNFHNSGLDYGYARICLKNHRGRVEMTFQAELCLCPDISTVKSKILPIVFVEDIPVKALMPNLVQLYQKTLLSLVQLYQKTLLSLIHLTRTNT